MEHRSISSKLPIEEYTELKAYCEKKQKTPSLLIRELISREIKDNFRKALAGKNIIKYNKDDDRFSWIIRLDLQIDNQEELNNKRESEVLNNISTQFLEDFQKSINQGLEERNIALGKVKANSVPIPIDILRNKDKKEE